MSDEGYREIHLTGKQLVFLFMTATVVAVVIFLLGVLVGRGVKAERDASADSTLVSPPQLVPDAAPAPAIDTQPAANPADTRPVAAPPPVDELSYPGRLEKKASEPETLTRASSAKPSASNTKGPSAAAKGSSAAAAPPSADAQSAEGTGEGISVQVAATKSRAGADALVKRLMAKGYSAYVFAPKGKSPAGVFRVRVGNFKTLKEAEDAARRLKEQEQFEPRIIR
jgi:cell division septation protein DedD